MSNTTTHDPSSGILFASSDHQVFVLDIPTTIAAAQSTPECSWTKRLVSRDALTAPLPSLEPKSGKARDRLLARGQGTVDDGDAQRVAAISDALSLVKSTYHGSLVLPRAVVARENCDEVDMAVPAPDEIDVDTNRHDAGVTQTLSLLINSTRQTVVTSSATCMYSHDNENWFPWSPHLRNSYARTLPLYIRTPASSKALKFHLPPHSSFLLHTLPPNTPSLAPTPMEGFDFILLDPPWPNRSVKRSGHYTSPRSLEDTRDLLSRLNLSAHVSEQDNATIAIWVTNSAAVRDIVCGADGWLSELGFDVAEEWLWIKTTTHGEPIYDLDGLWRKPYEVLIIAKRLQNSPSLDMRRRVLVAVPDVHSRKPSLKLLFERYILPSPYNGLEIFARNVTASWHSWGNEALLFNWEGHWQDQEV